MTFEFVCPFCHSRIRVDDRFAGLSGPCAECGKQVTMPGKPKAYAENQDTAKNVTSYPTLPTKFQTRSVSLVGALITIAIVACFATLVIILFLPSARVAIQVRQRTMGLSNAKQIADALNSYQRAYGSYPTPTVVDASGMPLYSWRVLILPQLGYTSLYNDFQLDQTWDSPTNSSLVSRMPPEFACPNNSAALAMHETNFALITGPGTMFPSGKAVDPNAMSDDPAETLLLVETKDGVATWTQPADLNISFGVKLGKTPMRDIGGNYPDCAVAVMVDGTAIAIEPNISRASLDAIISPNGNEKVDLSTVELSAKP